MTYIAYLCIFSGPSALRHFEVAAVCKKWRTSEDVLDSSDRAQKISRGAACLLLALQGQTASKVQPSGYGHGPATWHRQRWFPAKNRQCLVLQASARCCSSSPLFPRMIKKGSNTTVPLSLFLRSIREEDAQVACICIPSIYMHILHILHIFASRLD